MLIMQIFEIDIEMYTQQSRLQIRVRKIFTCFRRNLHCIVGAGITTVLSAAFKKEVFFGLNQEQRFIHLKSDEPVRLTQMVRRCITKTCPCNIMQFFTAVKKIIFR